PPEQLSSSRHAGSVDQRGSIGECSGAGEKLVHVMFGGLKRKARRRYSAGSHASGPRNTSTVPSRFDCLAVAPRLGWTARPTMRRDAPQSSTFHPELRLCASALASV